MYLSEIIIFKLFKSMFTSSVVCIKISDVNL